MSMERHCNSGNGMVGCVCLCVCVCEDGGALPVVIANGHGGHGAVRKRCVAARSGPGCRLYQVHVE
jgi:hypothetical protein